MFLVSELCQFVIQRKKYWLLPLVLAMLMLGSLMVLSETMLAPFIYTLF